MHLRIAKVAENYSLQKLLVLPKVQNRKFYFQGINSYQQKLKICIDVA